MYNWLNGLVGKVFADGSGDLSSILGCVRAKTLKMVLDTSLLNTQHTHIGGACCVMIIVVGNGHGDTSSNPGRD